MSLADLIARMQLDKRDAEMIFDRDEPVGQPTDLVMPRRRWFRKNHARAEVRATSPVSFDSLPNSSR